MPLPEIKQVFNDTRAATRATTPRAGFCIFATFKTANKDRWRRPGLPAMIVSGMSAMTDATRDLRSQVNALHWFHQIDFGNGLISPGAVTRSKIEQCSNIVFGRVDVSGKSVIDVGCWDGAYSIEASKRGAARVLATDHWVWHNNPYARKCFDLAHANIAPSIEVMDIDVPEISVQSLGTFDVALFMGVFYHLRHPFDALERVAKLSNECLVVETLLLPFEHKPVMRFCPGLGGDPTNWWAPSRSCVEAMLRDLGFRRVMFARWRWGRRGVFHAFR